MVVKQAQIVEAELNGTQVVQKVAFFDADGKPVSVGGGESGPVKWTDIEGRPSVFPPKIGTGATDAKAGNYKPTAAEVGAPTQAAFDALVARVTALEAAE